MVANREMIREKLVELEKYVRALERLQVCTLQDLQADLSKLWSVTHGLQLSIQILLDIGNHILSDQGIKASDYTDVIDRLGEANVIPEPFVGRIRGMAGFRNVIVHGYADIDIEHVHNTLQNNLGDFLRFAGYIDQYLDS